MYCRDKIREASRKFKLPVDVGRLEDMTHVQYAENSNRKICYVVGLYCD